MTGPIAGEGAERLLEGARAEAEQMGSDVIGAEHILLRATADPVADTAFRALGITPEAARERLVAGVRKGRGRAEGEELVLTSHARRLVEAASAEAKRRGAGEVGAEHLLLAAFRDPRGTVARMLNDGGVSAGAARNAVLAAIGADPEPDPEPEAKPPVARQEPMPEREPRPAKEPKPPREPRAQRDRGNSASPGRRASPGRERPRPGRRDPSPHRGRCRRRRSSRASRFRTCAATPPTGAPSGGACCCWPCRPRSSLNYMHAVARPRVRRSPASACCRSPASWARPPSSSRRAPVRRSAACSTRRSATPPS